jgi:NAD+ synthase (glutamine-hydrolysing)
MPLPLTIALAQVQPRKGDFAANLARLGPIFVRADSLVPRPDILHFPETALTGYFVEGGVRDLARPAGAVARDIAAVYRASLPNAVAAGRTLDVVIGFYERWQSTLYNSVIFATIGGAAGPIIHHVHRKMFLPTYGLFDEERFVERGHDLRAFDTPWGRAALLVCEDAWHSLTGTLAALDGAQIIFLSSAAPARGAWPRDDGIPGPASVARWDRVIRNIAEEHGVFVSYVNLVGTEAGKAFWGSSMIVGPAGDVRLRAPLFEESLLPATIDLADLARVRADAPLLGDLRTALPDLRTTLDRVLLPPPTVAQRTGGEAPVAFDRGIAPSIAVPAAPAADPRIAGGPAPLAIDGPLLERWLVQFIRDEFGRRDFAKAVVGLSGGVDSAVTAYLATRALGAEQVVGVRMPSCTSSPESLAHAQLVIDALGIPSRTIDISPPVDAYLSNEPAADPGRRGNVMARMRMIVLFDLSARYRALPVGTGNKTERLLGYFTWHADDSPPVNPLGDLFKTQVWALARHLGVPDVIVAKPASADLIAGQTDELDLGISYAKADDILNWILSGYSPDEIVARGYDRREVDLVRKRLDGTHWKRRLPTVAIISPNAIGESYLRPVDY